TVTAWMVSIFGFKMQITPIAISLIGIFFPFLFFGREKFRNLAEAMIGFGILFIGLEFIKDAVPNIQDNPEMFMFLDSFTDFGFASILLFVGAGTILTLLTQSSSAATAITLVMLFQGWIDFPIAAAMILGENIGTTITANIAALVGNVHAKRAARFHFIFNVIGVIWMLAILQPFLQGIDGVMQFFSPDIGSVFDDNDIARANATLALSLFHTVFNITNVLLLFAFVPRIIKLVERLQKDKEDLKSPFRLQYISAGMMSSAELSIAQAHKEIEQFAKLIEKMHFSFAGLFFKKQKMQEKFLEKIKKREQITDNIELEVAEYLTRISGANLSESATRRIRNMHSIINDLERVGDIYFQMSKTFEQMQAGEIELPEDAISEIGSILDLIHSSIQIVRENLDKTNGDVNLDKAILIENQINHRRDELKNSHYRRLETGAYSTKAGVMYLDYLTRLEKIGDHLFNVNESLADRKAFKSGYEEVVRTGNR
ncbi:MAG: Na/Pi symporter, partial [Balneolaceae bacterium]